MSFSINTYRKSRVAVRSEHVLFQNAQDCVIDRIYSICPYLSRHMVRYVQFRLILGCCLGVVVLSTNLPLITVRNCRAGTIARISSRPRFSALCCYSTLGLLGLLAICMLPSSTYKSRGGWHSVDRVVVASYSYQRLI